MFPTALSLSTALAAVLLLFLRTARAPCPPVFFAQAISQRQMRTMEFYFTKSGVVSAAECANLCGNRQFCQSAVFNHDAHNCALSPGRPVQCQMAKHRFNSFHLTTDGADAISLLACIQPCQDRREKEGFSHLLNIDFNPGHSAGTEKRALASEGDGGFPMPEILPVHDERPFPTGAGKDDEIGKAHKSEGFLGALQRLHEMQRRLEQILSEAARIRGKQQQEEEDDENGKMPADDADIGSEAVVATVALPSANYSAAVGGTSQVVTHTMENGTQVRVHSAGFVAKLKQGERIKLLRGGHGFEEGGVPSRLVQLGNTLAVKVPVQLITMAPELFESPTPSDISSSPSSADYSPTQPTTSGGPISDEGGDEPTVVDGRLQEPSAGFLQSLLIHHGKKAAEAEESLSLDASAASAQHPTGAGATVVCFRFVQNRRLQTLPGAAFSTERGFSLNQCRCACADTWRQDRPQKCRSLHFIQTNGICQLLDADHNQKLDLVLDRASEYHYVSCKPKYLLRTAEKMCAAKDGELETSENPSNADSTSIASHSPSTSSLPITTAAESTTVSASSTTNDPSLGVEANGCFERMAGFSLRGTAAGLERGVSEAECECLCANSLRSRMYSFQCASANYFHAERDCVLNLDSRHSAPEQFGPERAEQEVTYLGLLCSAERHLQQQESLLSACVSPGLSSSSPSPSPSRPIAEESESSVALWSDACFLEQPGYVLEGMALAVESPVDAAQCKCLCALAERRHGTNCQSAQFYAESGTCLLNRQNRASAPERFSFDGPGKHRHSYLDFRCSADRKSLADYLETNCQRELGEMDSMESNKSSESLANRSTSASGIEATTTAPLKLLPKGKRKKGRKQQMGGDLSSKTPITTSSPTTTQPTTTTEGSRNSSWTETEVPGEAQLETRTAVPSSVNNEEARIPESEGPEEEEKLMPGWRTVRVQRGDGAEPAQAQADASPSEMQRRDVTNSTMATASTTTTTVAATTSATTPSSTQSSLAPVSNLSSKAMGSGNSSSTSTTTTTTTTTTSSEYPPVGQCRFSALYQTVFNGARLLKRLLVDSPAQCLAACHFENCRSANLIQMEDKQKVCELFRDSIVEFRRNDVLSFDRLAVHFDSVQCKPRTE